MHGLAAAGAAGSTQSAALVRTAMARPAPLEEARESKAQKAAEYRQAPAQNPVRLSPSPEGVGETVDKAA
jgi:hypothetical protein